ncbi:MAG: MacB family efflux pump subunit [Lysobacteraceae bacterium]
MSALIEMRGISRVYRAGDLALTVLDGVDLDIEAGDMVAIIGPSGSGKSTLMNLIGCLDRPSDGQYRFDGRDTAEMDSDALAALRRERFGFIFQRYQLLPDLDAQDNTEVPAVYAGMKAQARRTRARALLERLGIGDRSQHRPSELSGGQQQRTSIARALMNGGEIILADEPTGALDTRSGEELMQLLATLNAQGHTVIIITHDPEVAAHARRVVEIRDGRIVSDRIGPGKPALVQPKTATAVPSGIGSRSLRDRLSEAFRMAMMAMIAHKLRTFLTMLGIIIGIASVTTVVALASGAKGSILDQISALGTNTVDIYPGEDFGDSRSGRVRTLVPGDADSVAALPYVDSVTPSVSTNGTLRYGNLEATAQINGVGAGHFRVRGTEIAEGGLFDDASERGMEQVVVIDANTRKRFFTDRENPIGRILLLGRVPCRVIGVTEKSNGRFGGGNTLNVWVPYTTAMGRILGRSDLSGITVRVRDGTPVDAAEQALTRMLTLRHGSKDFFTSNSDDIRSTIEATTQVMTMLISSIALISLLVGGIGVMNIMLVSVTERTREIGVRMAVGARQSDILQQFLIEAVMICLVGGALGACLALLASVVFNGLFDSFKMNISMLSLAGAFACSTLVGVVFGFLPARKAARMNPVEALARE